ncbi:MAG TPA: B12-binding domain-containing radical SAM protein, partial [Deltaproteobacteria bacterium]|nr:B12-binding domain-containing radical SAM protein [Deltaproteobacteria bacterium]
MLDLAGIPLLRRERGDGEPVILGGGVCTLNPAPVAEFFDALLVGDGEEAILEIVDQVEKRKTDKRTRDELLRELSRIEGVYVPGISATVSRRVLPDLKDSPLIPSPILPAMRVVHDRLSLEISRGCTRGCRFCQAGYWYRPARERSPDRIAGLVGRGLCATGYEEVGLLSLSAGDYSSIGPLLVRLMDAHAEDRVSVSLPSLRVDSLDPRLLQEVSRVRKTGFTIAPEAGTERLRRVVNKNVTEDDILGAVDRIFGAGWKSVKLYFMIGLPTE